MNAAVQSPGLDRWDEEGGAPAWQADPAMRVVDSAFEAVADVLRLVARKQTRPHRERTKSILAILQEKRAEVVARHPDMGFIAAWQAGADPVRELLFSDARYQAIRKKKTAHRAGAAATIRVGRPRR